MKYGMWSIGPDTRPALAWLLCAAASLLLGACASVKFENTADRLPWTPLEVANASGHVTGTVVWGGRIVAIENLSNGTEFQVLGVPLKSGNVPDTGAASIGRFVAFYPGYLEPEDFAPGRYVSLAGRLDGTVEGSVGEGVIMLPYVHTAQVHLWPRDIGSWNPRWNIGVGVGIRL